VRISSLYFVWLSLALIMVSMGCAQVSTNELLNGTFLNGVLKISPSVISVTKSTTQQFTASGGNPPYTFRLVTGTGSATSGGLYTAPDAYGSAIIAVTDTVNAKDYAEITVVEPLACPTNYVFINKNVNLGTSYDFCVAKYEMKCGNDATGASCSGSPLSQAAGVPWKNVNQNGARLACSGLGSRYHLIKNAEWMTIARDIESVGANWQGGTVYNGEISRGWSINGGGAIAASTDDTNPCFGTTAACSDVAWHSLRRTFKLSTGAYLWDFAGNGWELTDFFNANDKPGADGAGTQDVNSATPTATMPETAFKSANTALTWAQGIGQMQPGSNTGSVGVVVRGGNTGAGTLAGIYAIQYYNASSNLEAFRCVYSQ
jgi:hypothetical protein